MKISIRTGGLAAAILTLSVTGSATAQEQAVTIVVNEEPANLDPCEAASDFIGRVALGNIFEALTRRDVETGEVLPALATGWEEGENNAWTFTLRDGVTFHDGTPMTAASVKHAMDRTLDTNLSCESRTKFFGDGEYGVEVVGDNAVKVTTQCVIRSCR